ncbi:MAG: iron-sulfur cluster assembly scaffold protein [Candidatus Paceibacterota bacterium]
MPNNFYTKKVMNHFKKPHNYGRLEKADGVGTVGNAVCGDVMRLYIKIGLDKKKQEVIKDIKFETFGCVAAIASSSAITDLAKGKTLKSALKISKAGIADSLGGLPPVKMHCSLLASDALAEAAYDYLFSNKKEIPSDLEAKHKQISKDRKRMEKKYKDWMEEQKKIMDKN